MMHNLSAIGSLKTQKRYRVQSIIQNIKNISKLIYDEIKFADFTYADTKNSTGDNQLKLDILSDDIITKEFSKNSKIKSLISEEKQDELIINPNEHYIIAYDPLDGSSVIDVNFSTGSIFAVYKDAISSQNLIMAIYVIYGARLELVICENTLPKLYRVDKNGDFVFIKDLTLGNKGKISATGGTQKNWNENHRKFIKSLFDEDYRLRYSGAMVSDLHQILIKGGGIFSYPCTSDNPNGKLRLAFEVLPFAYIYEKAGGMAVDGKKRLLDININKAHSTTPCFFGSKYEIEKLIDFDGL